MSVSTQQAGETILLHGECLDLRQPIAWAGVLTITDHRVFFVPTRLNRILSARAWELSLDAISDVELVGLKKCMRITSGKKTLRIMGKDVEVLFARLHAIMAEGGSAQHVDPLFEKGERIVLRSETSLIINVLVWTSGNLTLTNRRLRFEPRRKWERWLWRKHCIDAPLGSIRAGKLDVVRKRLELRLSKKSRVFAGPITPRLYAYINAIARDGGADCLMGCWQAQLHRGALAQKGELLFSTKRMLFVSAGAVEAMMGTREELDILISDVNRLQVDGTVDARLVAQVGKETHIFVVDQPGERVNDIVPVLLNTNSPNDPPTHGPLFELEEAHANAPLDPWLDRMGLARSKIKLAGPAVHVSSKPGARRGWLMLRPEEVIFVPGGSSTYRSRPVILPTLHLVPPLEDDGHSPQLRLSGDGATVRLLPRGEEKFVERFWALWQDDRAQIMSDAKQRRRDHKQAMRERQVANADGSNRRETYRVTFPKPRPIQILIVYPDETRVPRRINCLTINVSEGGACVISRVPREVDSEFFLIFDPDTLAFPMPARIVHSKKVKKGIFRLGIEFLDIEIDLALRVRSLVMQIQRDELQMRAETDI